MTHEMDPPMHVGDWWIAKFNAACIVQIVAIEGQRGLTVDESGKKHWIGAKGLSQRFRRYGVTPEEQRIILRSKLAGYACALKSLTQRVADADREDQLQRAILEDLSSSSDAEYDLLSEAMATEIVDLLNEPRWIEIAKRVEAGSFPVCR